MGARKLELSVVVPFCKAKCDFCDAHVLCNTKSAFKESYVQALYRELCAVAPEMDEYELSSINVTGGSPNLLGGAVLAELLGLIRNRFACSDSCETSIAFSPTMASIDMFQKLRGSKVDRIELEVDTTDVLQHLSLGKGYLMGASEDVAQVIVGSGMRNLDCSVLYGLEGQGVPSLQATIDKCIGMGASHFSLRRLRFPEGSKIHASYERQLHADKSTISPRHVFPDDERSFQLYKAAADYLGSKGFIQYTQRHFALEGFQSRRVQDACCGVERLGLGLGAQSSYDGVECRNTQDMDLYLAFSGDYEKILVSSGVVDDTRQRQERLVAGLFSIEGVPACAELAHGDELIARGWLEERGGRRYLTKLGGFHYNDVHTLVVN